jgi:hypothetical protein
MWPGGAVGVLRNRAAGVPVDSKPGASDLQGLARSIKSERLAASEASARLESLAAERRSSNEELLRQCVDQADSAVRDFLAQMTQAGNPGLGPRVLPWPSEAGWRARRSAARDLCWTVGPLILRPDGTSDLPPRPAREAIEASLRNFMYRAPSSDIYGSDPGYNLMHGEPGPLMAAMEAYLQQLLLRLAEALADHDVA